MFVEFDGSLFLCTKYVYCRSIIEAMALAIAVRSLQCLWTLCLLVNMNGLAGSAQELGIFARFFSNHVVISGSHADFDCRAEGFNQNIHENLVFTWKHNNSAIDMDRPKYTVRYSGLTEERTLRINSPLSFDDAGMYTCNIDYSVKADQTQSVMNVSDQDKLRIATELTITVEPVQYGVIGQPGRLICLSHSRPTPTLTLTRASVTPPPMNPMVEPKSSVVLDFPSVLETDAGTYKCRAINSFGEEQMLIEFKILRQPTITHSPNNTVTIVMVDSTLSLRCDVNSDAMYNMTRSWSFTPADSAESVQLSLGPHPRHTIHPDTGELTVTEATFEDSGQYTCTVSNAVGSDSHVYSVDVQAAPVITIEGDPVIVRTSVNSTLVLLHCPYTLSKPQPSVSWYHGGELVTQSSKYTVYDNGTLKIFNLTVPSDSSSQYRCELVNVHGQDSRNVRLEILDVPLEPILNLTSPSNDWTVILTWTEWTETSDHSVSRKVDYYIIERSVNQGVYTQVGEISALLWSYTLTQFLPGERYKFRVRAVNVAGVSSPSNAVTHTPTPREPSLSSFQAAPFTDGRSVLFTWVLEYDGGSDITQFSIQVATENKTVLTVELNVSEEKAIITNLNPETEYTFTVLVGNSIGTTSLQAIGRTPPAVPSQPSSLTVSLLSFGSFSLTFSLRQGSQPLTHFLVNYTLTDSPEPPSQLTVELTQVISLEETDSRARDREYRVVLRVSGLSGNNGYEFRVAGVSALGEGQFTDWEHYQSKEHIIIIIIGSVIGSTLLVVMVILTAVGARMCRKKFNKGKKIAINGSGSLFSRPRIDVEANRTDAFVLRSPPPGYREGSSNKIPLESPSSEEREDISSPCSYTNGYSHSLSSSVTKLHTQTSISGTNLDTVVDMPNNNLSIRIVKDFHSSTKSVPNTSCLSPSPEVNRQHLCLQTSLNSMNLGTGDQNNSRSIVSEKHLLYVPTTTQDGVLSSSNPVINRLSCDSVLDTMATSYMTDV